MRAPTHLLVPMTPVLLTAIRYPEWFPNPLWAFLGIMALGTLLPDLDHPHALISKRLPWLSKPLTSFVSHRSGFHSLLAGCWCVCWLPLAFWWGHWSTSNHEVFFVMGWFFAGWFTHLALDALTPMGVPFLWPYQKRFHLAYLSLSKLQERWLLIFYLALVVGSWLYFTR